MTKEPKWNKIFETVAVNAFERLNLTYRSWQYNFTTDDLEDIVKGYLNNRALTLLSETAVTQNLFVEFINSPLTNGVYVDQEHRHYEIQREVDFYWTTGAKEEAVGVGLTKDHINQKKTVDLVVNRFAWKGKDRVFSRIPSLIEAKRAHSYHMTSDGYQMGATNVADIQADIAYLTLLQNRKNVTVESYGDNETFRTYILIWEYEGEPRRTNKKGVINSAKSCIKDILTVGDFEASEIVKKIRIIPTDIDEELNVISCIWFLLHEIPNPIDKTGIV